MEMNNFGDKAMAQDLLNSEKMLTANYNTALCESATAEVRHCLSGILESVLKIQESVYDDMNARGWYPAPKAEDQKISEARTKFENTRATM